MEKERAPLEKTLEKTSEKSFLPSARRLLSGEDEKKGRDLDGGVQPPRGIDLMAERARFLGIPPPKAGKAPCVLPHHEDHDSWMVAGDGSWKYWCPGCQRRFTVAEVRGILAYANVPYGDERDQPREPEWTDIRVPAGRVEISRWAELLDFECGLLERQHLGLIIPTTLSEAGLRAARQVCLLLELRNREKWANGLLEFTFSRRFCRARTGLGENQSRAAIEELVQLEVIKKIGTSGRATTYRYAMVEPALPPAKG